MQVGHTKALSSKVSDAALTRLRCLFISCCSFSFCSILTAADFVVNLHTFWSAGKASRSVGAISPALRSRLQTSLYRRVGLPAVLEPVASSPYMTKPAKSSLCQYAEHAGDSSPFKDFIVGDVLLPGDTQDSPDASEVEGVQSLLLSGVKSPALTSVHESTENTSLPDTLRF